MLAALLTPLPLRLFPLISAVSAAPMAIRERLPARGGSGIVVLQRGDDDELRTIRNIVLE